MSKDMSVYYFHVRRGNVIYIDHQGVELADLRSAWDHALDDAALLFRKEMTDPDDDRWIEVHDLLGLVASTPPEGTVIQ
jgi:hypothetical protein